jgi:hypothetical protein
VTQALGFQVQQPLLLNLTEGPLSPSNLANIDQAIVVGEVARYDIVLGDAPGPLTVDRFHDALLRWRFRTLRE